MYRTSAHLKPEARKMSQCSPGTGEPRIAVLGGGILGAVLSLRLRRSGFAVTLLEAEDGLGGLAAGAQFGTYTWDRFYHVILLSDFNTRELIEEVGLSDRLRWGTTKTGFYTDGSLHSMSNTMEFLRFPPLSLLDKLRLGWTIFLSSKIRHPQPLEQVLAIDWLRQRSGRNVVEKIWTPLLKSKLGRNYRIASAAFIWAIIARMYAARRSGIKQEMFGYLEGGYGQVHARLRDLLLSAGVDVRTGFAVECVSHDASGHLIRSRSGESLRADFTVSTLPPAITARIAPQLTTQERDRLTAVTYQGIICASVLLRRPLSGYYVTNITDDWVPFTGVIEMTALVDPKRSFGGNSLVYLPLYLPQDAEQWGATDEHIRGLFLQALSRMYRGFNLDDVIDFQVARARQVLAISTLDYTARLAPPVSTSVPGLYTINSSQIAYGTLNVNETLGLISKHLPELLAHLEAQPHRRPVAAPPGPASGLPAAAVRLP